MFRLIIVLFSKVLINSQEPNRSLGCWSLWNYLPTRFYNVLSDSQRSCLGASPVSPCAALLWTAPASHCPLSPRCGGSRKEMLLTPGSCHFLGPSAFTSSSFPIAFPLLEAGWSSGYLILHNSVFLLESSKHFTAINSFVIDWLWHSNRSR